MNLTPMRLFHDKKLKQIRENILYQYVNRYDKFVLRVAIYKDRAFMNTTIKYNMVEYAASKNYFGLLRWCCKNGMDTNIAVETAVRYTDNGEMVKYLIENGCHHDYQAILSAVELDKIELVEYLYYVSYSLYNHLTYTAAMHNSVKSLKFLLENNCAIDYRMLPTAIEIENIECIKIMLDHFAKNGMIERIEWSMHNAEKHGNKEIVELIHSYL